MKIADRTISPESPTFIIAEIGVNHDGCVQRALELVQAARAAGADAVKLQIFTAQNLMHRSTSFASYQADRCEESSASEMLRRYELSDADLKTVVKAIRSEGMIPIATPFSLQDIAKISDLNLPAIKIASPDLVNRPLLERAAQLHTPLLISTGASTLIEIETTVGWLQERNATFSLLHCISSYPTADADANLGWISQLKNQFNVSIGYSDHTTELLSGALAVAAGAVVIEKHLTYDRSAAGPDHAASFDPLQFQQYVQRIRQAEKLRGHGERRVLDAELDVRTVSRQSLVLQRDVKMNQPIHEFDLTVQRPGTGISAADFAKVIGRKTRAPIAAGTLLTWDMLHAA